MIAANGGNGGGSVYVCGGGLGGGLGGCACVHGGGSHLVFFVFFLGGILGAEGCWRSLRNDHLLHTLGH